MNDVLQLFTVLRLSPGANLIVYPSLLTIQVKNSDIMTPVSVKTQNVTK